MARPSKQGLDYFPLDVDMDSNVEILESKYGLAGFATLIKIWQYIYKNKGYYMVVSEEHLLLLHKRTGLNNYKLFIALLSDCLEWEIFDSTMYKKYQILTSSGIQRRYMMALKRRKDVRIYSGFLLLNPKDGGLDESALSTETPINVNRNPSYCKQKPLLMSHESGDVTETPVNATETGVIVTSDLEETESKVVSPEYIYTEHVQDTCVNNVNHPINGSSALRLVAEIADNLSPNVKPSKKPAVNLGTSVIKRGLCIQKRGFMSTFSTQRKEKKRKERVLGSSLKQQRARDNTDGRALSSFSSDDFPEAGGRDPADKPDGVITQAMVDDVLAEYPHSGMGNQHMNRQEAGLAVGRVARQRECSFAEAVDYLKERAAAFAVSDTGTQERRYVPRASTFFRDEIYNQPDESWQMDAPGEQLMTWEEAFAQGFKKSDLEKVPDKKDEHGRAKVRLKGVKHEC